MVGSVRLHAKRRLRGGSPGVTAGGNSPPNRSTVVEEQPATFAATTARGGADGEHPGGARPVLCQFLSCRPERAPTECSRPSPGRARFGYPAYAVPGSPDETLRHRRAVSSAHVDVDHLDGVVAVAEPVPGWDLRLDVAGGVGRPGAEGVPAYGGGVPVQPPVLPRVGARGLLELRLVPVALAGEADLHARHRAGARPRLASYGAGAGVENRRRSGGGDPGTHTHEVDLLGRAIGPLVHV